MAAKCGQLTSSNICRLRGVQCCPQAAAIISDYEHARQAELSSLMSRYTDAKAVAAEAQQAKLEARCAYT